MAIEIEGVPQGLGDFVGEYDLEADLASGDGFELCGWIHWIRIQWIGNEPLDLALALAKCCLEELAMIIEMGRQDRSGFVGMNKKSTTRF